VYEGYLTVLDGGALQLDLKGYEGDRVVPHIVRFDFEQDGTLRHRVWSLNGTERKLMLDVHHKELEPKNAFLFELVGRQGCRRSQGSSSRIQTTPASGS
jgi:hypothetical protein